MGERAPAMAAFRTPQERLHTHPAAAHAARAPPAERRPPEEPGRPMTIDERYDLAVAIDNLPEELLDGVVEVLARARKIKAGEAIRVSFRDLEDATLRAIEDCVKRAKLREPDVKRMRMSESAIGTPEQKQKFLDDEIARTRARLRDKRPNGTSGDVTSETYTTDDGSGSTAGSDDEASSG
jgi:hypothetical protein